MEVESRERAPRMRPLFARVAVHRFFVLRQGSLEASYTFAQALTQFGDLLGAEHQNRNAQEGKAIMWRVLKLGGPILALRYLRAAQRDESDGLTFTAAMEWRKAAELSSCITLLSNRYWREWERIMHLPRRLAEPIGLAPINAVAVSSSLEISLSRSRAASRVYLRLHPGVQFRALIFRLLTVTADTVPDSRVAG